jgi:putative FmdB family regulatory protein
VPLYEYECRKCGQRTEKIENFSGPYLKKCPKCGGKIDRLLGAPAIQFKGSGWYVTDYAGKGSGGDSSKGEKAEGSEAKPAEAKPAKDSKDTAPSKDAKKTGAMKKEK